MSFSDIEVSGFKSVLDGFPGGSKETPFLTISVNDYLWGYPSVLTTVDKYTKCLQENEDNWFGFDDDPCENLLNDDNVSKMGIFHGRNGSSLDIRKINTGMNIVS